MIAKTSLWGLDVKADQLSFEFLVAVLCAWNLCLFRRGSLGRLLDSRVSKALGRLYVCITSAILPGPPREKNSKILRP